MEVIAIVGTPRTKDAINRLRAHGLLTSTKVNSVCYCSTPGLRTDVVRSAEKAADNTGTAQRIEYGFDVLIETGHADEPRRAVRTTLVLPDFDRRLAIVARAPQPPAAV